MAFGGKPLPVRDVLIAQLYERNSDAPVAACLTPGETVRINEGLFAELKAIFLTMEGSERVVLLMNFLLGEQVFSLPLAGVSRL